MLSRLLVLFALVFGAAAAVPQPTAAAPVGAASSSATLAHKAYFIQYPRELYPHMYRRRSYRPRYSYRPRSYRPRYYYYRRYR